MDDNPNLKRRWFERSRRPLLLALPLVFLLAWFAVKMEHAGKQKAVVEEFENLGGVVWYDYQFDADGIPLAKEEEPPGPAWLRRLLGDDFFMNVTKLDLTQTEIADAELKHVDALTELQSLGLGSGATDAGLQHLKGLTRLHTLNLRVSRVTDAGLLHLEGLRQLQSLDLLGTKVTAEGVKKLQQSLPQCRIEH